ncbi:MAG: hypothetical protein NTY07_07245 [Bacteroidia bacterium]|nr:hypothetical protein [Bacteroidia bacterium]
MTIIVELNNCRAQKESVFLAIRNNKIGLYHKGGLLFSFDKDGYKTHLKYAAVIESNGKNYVSEKDILSHKLLTNFETGYDRIKENCFMYSGIEAAGVSEIYHRHSYMSGNDIVVLDIEVSFTSYNEENKQDRIDMLLYNTTTQTLQFVEAKHYSNKEIWSTTEPKVINQIRRYENQIYQRKAEIVSEYVGYVETIKEIFGINLPEPKDIDPKVTLLIFGFDADQLKGRLTELIKKNPFYKGTKVYLRGDVKKLETKTLWNTKE